MNWILYTALIPLIIESGESDIDQLILEVKKNATDDLNELYLNALNIAFQKDKVQEKYCNMESLVSMFRTICGGMIVSKQQPSVAQLSEILELEVDEQLQGKMGVVIKRLQPFLMNKNLSLSSVLQFHKTFVDFIQDPIYCKDSIQ